MFGSWLGLLANSIYDWRRYSRHSFAVRSRTRENNRAIIHILAHALEHGMSLSAPRPGFGRQKANSLAGKLESYIDEYGPDRTTDMAIAVLGAYRDFHAERGLNLSDLADRLDAISRSPFDDEPAEGGTLPITRAQIEAATGFDYDRFIRARHSVRQFADRPVGVETIKRAVVNAQRAPSVCNRQTCRVYALTNKEAIASTLNYQSGNAGFGHEIGVLFVITSDMQQLNLIGERYQGWVDGGIFAMCLLLSLHAENLGTCCLNWSVEKERDRALRAHLGIPDEELVITMMAAGHLKETFAVPVSKRKSLGDVLVLDPVVGA